MPEKTLLGFDFGTKRIGVAVGQTLTSTASPLTQVNNNDWKSIKQLVEEWRPHAFVVGLPLNMDDTESSTSIAAKAFAKQLQTQFGLAVHLCDERLSSREAIERLADAGHTKPSKAEINSMAAAVILESWLHK